MINATIEKFGYPATLVVEGTHWVVLLRPQAVTLGSLILAAKGDATRYGDLPTEAFAEQGRLVRTVELALRAFTDYDKMNYLMLMMVDPHVHFHLIPRYHDSRGFAGIDYPDAGWPGLPDLAAARTLDGDTVGRMIEALKGCGLG